ncbi:unnamed protein product, partial [marine sediment metagenome]
WWFDSREETGGIPPPAINDSYGLVTNNSLIWGLCPWDDHDPLNVIPLVDDLAWYMDTDGQRTMVPHNGTDVMDMQQGIRDYLNATPYNDSYYEVTVEKPDFLWIEDEVKRCEDVILLLGFWTAEDDYMPPEAWWRVGGHYVTCAGVNSDTWQLAISDPMWDISAPAGGSGVHNNTTYVSHDIYNVTGTFTPGGNWSLENYAVGDPGIANFMGQNANPNSSLPVGPYLGPMFPLHVEIEYAVAVSPIVVDATLVGNVTFE